MTTNAANLIAAATAAALAIKAVGEEAKEAKEAAFRASAEATATAIDGGVSAVRIAEANKAAGAGYGSDAAVGFHALTGKFLRLAEADWDGSAQSIQTSIKKIGQPKAKNILKKAKDIDGAVEALAAAVADLDFDCDKALAALVKAAQKLADARVAGGVFFKSEDSATALESLEVLLATIDSGKAPVEVTAADLRVA